MADSPTPKHEVIRLRPGTDKAPTSTPTPRQVRLTELAEGLSRTLALARALIQSGRTLDLTGVDNGVGMLCAQTLDMPPDEARRMLPALLELVGQVDLLSALLRMTPQPASPAC